ncbi:MAG: ABC transporter ATP-binding protein [Candidatus Poseidoniales archaeon]|nr:MAG: ABC transporter ATP-binding protein [Candidatus Poseidoniales archaeon]
MNENLLHLTDVSKSFGDVHAIEHVSLNIQNKSIVGLVGGNGAGKTTLLRMMAGIYKPTKGRVHLQDGQNVDQMRSVLGVVPESTGLYSKLTAWENIRFHSRIHGVEDSLAWSRTIRFAELLDMQESLHRYTEGFSRGMRQKTALLRALAHGPSILLLDEPTAGLDVTSARIVRKLVQKLKDEGGTVIYSTHHLAEAEQVCDRIIIVHNGTIRADGTPEELLQYTNTNSLEEAYVSLTTEVARPRQEDTIQTSKFALLWRRLFTRNHRYEVNEDE